MVEIPLWTAWVVIIVLFVGAIGSLLGPCNTKAEAVGYVFGVLLNVFIIGVMLPHMLGLI